MAKEKLINARRKKGCTQKELAEKIGISKSAYSFYEQGRRIPREKTINKICEELDATADIFY